MLILVLTKYSIADSMANTVAATIALPFNPIKLILLIAWVYLCLYFVQQVQYGTLVPQKYKPIANFVTLFTGPILLFILMVVDIAKSSTDSDRNVLDTMKEHLQNAFSAIGSIDLLILKREPAIKLLDSAGRSIKEIYGHGKSNRQDRHTLNLTERMHIVELNTIKEALQKTQKNIDKAAKLLGTSQRTLRKKLQMYEE